MSEVIFSKKQIGPLVAKYGINTKSETFCTLIELFADQINYQIWAIKLVYSGVCDINTIKSIAAWCASHKTDIQNLTKRNVILYSKPADINRLKQEMQGLDMMGAVKNTINKFNTAQRKMLTSHIFDAVPNGYEAKNNSSFKGIYETFRQFETLPNNRKEKVISLASALTNATAVMDLITKALEATYEWDKEDMLSFMARNCKDCKVVFDQGPIVIITVPSFASSEKLCGKGRTSWCLTRESRYFSQYVKEPKDAVQYFFFDFSKKENHDLAHVGFTVRSGQGITNAHSTKNNCMTGDGIIVDGQRINISKLLTNNNVPTSVYIHLKELTKYNWDLTSAVKFIGEHNAEYAIAYNKNNIVVVSVLSARGQTPLLDHTLITSNRLTKNNDNALYVILNFNKPVDDNNAIVMVTYNKDQFKTLSMSSAVDCFNNSIETKDCLKPFKLKESDFLEREEISPNIQLLKFIAEGKEGEAIHLIEQTEDIDVNFVFNEMTPIFEAMERSMFKLFEVILNHKTFKTVRNSIEETLLSNLLRYYKIPNVTSEESDKNTERLIKVIIDSQFYDINLKDSNLDTAISVACERPETNWVVELLVKNDKVNLNTVNDADYTPLGNAIRRNNVEAIKMLASRSDLTITEKDMKEASSRGIDLGSMLPPKTKLASVSSSPTSGSETFEDIFARAFARFNS